jgi:hypothetical protein
MNGLVVCLAACTQYVLSHESVGNMSTALMASFSVTGNLLSSLSPRRMSTAYCDRWQGFGSTQSYHPNYVPGYSSEHEEPNLTTFTPSALSNSRRVALGKMLRALSKEATAAAKCLDEGAAMPPSWMLRDLSSGVMSLRLVCKALQTPKAKKVNGKRTLAYSRRRSNRRKPG